MGLLSRPRYPQRVFGIEVDETIAQGGFHHEDCVMHSYRAERVGVELTAPCRSCETKTVVKDFDADTPLTFEAARTETRKSICSTCCEVNKGKIEELTRELRHKLAERQRICELFTSPDGTPATLDDRSWQVRLRHPDFMVIDHETRMGDILIPGWLQDRSLRTARRLSEIYKEFAWQLSPHAGWHGFRQSELQKLASQGELDQRQKQIDELKAHKQRMDAVAIRLV